MAKKFLKIISSPGFYYFVLAWFIFQAIFMAYSTRYSIPPDEGWHVGFIQLFSRSGWLPFIHNQESYYFLGEVTHSPFFLYHYLLSLPYHLIGDWSQSVFILRLFNIAMGAGTLVVVHKICRELKVSDLVKNISLFMLGGTLMFTFLSASVNSDNAVTLLSVTSIWLMLKLINKFSAKTTLALAVVLATGLLTKVTFIPVAFAVLAAIFYAYMKKWRSLPKDFTNSAKVTPRATLVFTACLVILGIIGLQRYGSNLVTYHQPTPSCTKVLTLNQCREYDIFERNEILANNPPLPRDRGPIEYTLDWFGMMLERTYGVFAHKSFPPLKPVVLWVEIFVLVAAVAIIRQLNSIKSQQKIILLLMISLFFGAILIAKNYRTYSRTGIFGLALQGRYLFPVLPLLYIVGNHYIFNWIKSNTAKAVFAGVIIVVFFIGGLPSYIYRTTPEWHTSSTTQLNSSLKRLLNTSKDIL